MHTIILMMHITPLTAQTQAVLVCADDERQAALRTLALAGADISHVLLEKNVARGWYSLWHTRSPQFGQHRTGCLGHFYADTRETALALLAHAVQQARERGVSYLIGPLDGDTWHGYRLTTDTCGHLPFFLDRLTPTDWPGYFLDAGFGAIAEYFSTEAPASPYEESAAQAWEKRFLAGGQWRLRALNLEDFEGELRRIYELSCRAFARNFLYTPIEWPAFLSQYLPLRPLIRPEFVRMAFRGEELAGFCLCLPDYEQTKRGEAIDALILKTFARDPDPAYKGLGAFLLWHCHVLAAEHGFKRLITAFMHEDNASLRLTLKAGAIIRKYALYGRGV